MGKKQGGGTDGGIDLVLLIRLLLLMVFSKKDKLSLQQLCVQREKLG